MQTDAFKKEIVKTIECLSQRHGVSAVFRDWVECMALAIANGCTPRGELWQKREKRYLDIIGKYEKDEVQAFPEMFAKLTECMTENPFCDYLGEIYMEAIGGNSSMGQVFTPMSVSVACAQWRLQARFPNDVQSR